MIFFYIRGIFIWDVGFIFRSVFIRFFCLFLERDRFVSLGLVGIRKFFVLELVCIYFIGILYIDVYIGVYIFLCNLCYILLVVI